MHFFVSSGAAPAVCPGVHPAVSMFMIGGRMYHQSTEEHEFKDAKRYCNNLNLELASVGTAQEYDNVKNHMGELKQWTTGGHLL